MRIANDAPTSGSHCAASPLRLGLWPDHPAARGPLSDRPGTSRFARRRLVRPLWAVPLLLVAVVAGLSGVASADTGPPVFVQLAGRPRPAQIGQVFRDTLIVTSGVNDVLMGLTIEGDSWTAVSYSGPSEFSMTPGVPVRVPFQGTPAEGPYPLLVSFHMGTMVGHLTIDLSAEAYQHTLGPGPLEKIPDASAPPPPAALRAKPMPVPPLPAEMLQATVTSTGAITSNASGPATATQARSIRVHGRFGYVRSDNLFVGGDAVAVRGYHKKDWGDSQLFAVATDAFGYFDVTFFWNSNSENPDLYLIFELNNSKVHVKGTDLLSSTYSWQTSVTYDYPGSDLDYGTVAPPSDRDRKAVHIHTDFVRGWRWFFNHGYDCQTVAGRFPDASWSFTVDWISYGKAIFILDTVSNSHAWLEAVHLHEYGHHFINCFGKSVGSDYCNGICDSGSQGCGHCMWCRETDHDAYEEGFADWVGDIITRSLQGDYGIKPLTTLNMEGLATCSGPYDDPTRTEGFLGAVMRDIEDGTQDVHGVYPGGADELALGDAPILTTVTVDKTFTPMGFLNAFKARYPQYAEGLWATAKNCGYELDQFEPGVVTNLVSTTHTVGIFDSTNPKITYAWTRASDDCSGVGGYSVMMTQYDPAFGPDGTIDIGDVTSYTTGTLAPGNWWFSIRAIDRAGRVSTNWTKLGAIGIRAAIPANLVQALPFGWTWEAPLVPRAAADGVPSAVTGDAYSYANNLVWNTGEVSTGVVTYTNLYVDGIFGNQYGILPLEAGAINTRYITVVYATGGLHTLSGVVDATNAVLESDETDNSYGHQWAWTPSTVASGAMVERASPPSPYGGTSTIPSPPIHQNLDGMRLATNPLSDGHWWTACWMHSLDNAADYDLYLYQPTSWLTNGFVNAVAGSAYGRGALDFVLVNNNLQPAQNWDAGILDYTDVLTGNYHLGVSGSSALSPSAAQSLAVSFAQDEMLKLWEVWVFGADVGPVSVVADLGSPSQGPVHLAWFDRSTTVAGQSNASASAGSDPQTGRVRLDLNVSAAGYYCLVLYRNPTGGAGKISNPPISVTMKVEKTPPDFEPLTFFGWYAPLVPRVTADGNEFNAPAPLTLPGGGTTYLNLMATNASPTFVPSFAADVLLDGQAIASPTLPVDPGLGTAFVNNTPQLVVSGGRHVLSMRLDPSNLVEEIYETNNLYGEPWVWTPLQLALNTPVTRGAPPVLNGGWVDITTLDPLYYNCDGLRTPVFAPSGADGYFAAVALMPGAASDVDLALFETSSGAKSGFDLGQTSSAWGTAQSDYVLANFHVMPFRAFDAGVMRWTGTQGYTAEVVASTSLGTAKAAHGPYTLGSGHILQLFEVGLSAGFYNIRLENVTGSVDWGITLHDALVSFGSKSAPQPGWFANVNGPGQNEYLTVQIPVTGNYCLSVWKAGAVDLASSGQFRLVFDAGATDVSGDQPGPRTPPEVTALRDAHPNPFNPRTTVEFDLAHSGSILVAIYNLRGQLVRTLESGVREAGHYSVVWDGIDDTGLSVASGVYLVQLQSAGALDRRKLMLVK
jgi:hypothetical protein